MAKNNKSKVIATLEKDIDELRARLWEVISENDRLTLTYEPFQPEGDEYEGVQYFDLIDENDSLAAKLLDKLGVIRELEARIRILEQAPVQRAPKIPYKAKKVKKQPRYFGSASLDYWPPSDYLRFSLKRYGNHEWQFTFGPIRIDFSRN